MHIRNIGFNHIHDADFIINRPRGTDDFLFLLLKTPAHFTMNGSNFITEPNSFILYSPNAPQQYRAYGSQFSNDFFHFKLHKNETLLNDLEIPYNQIISLGDINEISMLINNLCYETYSSNRYKTEIIELYLTLFFTKLSNKIHEANKELISSTYYNKMSIIRTKIYNQPFLNWNIEGLSHELTMSKSSFQQLYKKNFGVSAITDVILSRVEHAKYLLSTTHISIKKISEMCGYNNDIHFMRQFKQIMKITPTMYRKRSND